MGYGVTAHIVRQPVDAAALKVLPRGLKWRLYRDEAAGAWLIDVHVDERGGRYPFTQGPDALERPTGGRSKTRELDVFYRALETLELDLYVPPGVAALSKLLSAALGQEVLSVASDDDGMDIACLSRGGALVSVEYSSEADVSWTADGVLVRPLVSEEDESAEDEDELDEESEGESESLDAVGNLDGVTILESAERGNQLHGLAMQRAAEFLSGRATFLDLGSFDCLTRIPAPIAQSDAGSGSGGGGFWPFGRKT